MAVVTEVLARLSADTSKFSSGFRDASRTAESFGDSVAHAEGRTKGLFSTMTGATAIGNLLSRGFSMASHSVMGFGREIIGQAMNMQQAQMAFEQFLGGADKAKAKLDELRDFSAATPFEFPDLVESTKQMLALGFGADEVLKKVKDKNGKTFFTGLAVDAGDAAAMLGQGTEGVERITRALGRMKLKGKATGEEMMMLTEGGLPAWKYLSAAMGKPVGELQKMMEKGLIPAEAAIAAVRKGMQKDFGGGMIKQSQTLQGLLSTLKDTIFGEFVKAAQPLVETISKVTGGLITLAQNVIPKVAGSINIALGVVTQFGERLASGFGGAGKMADPVVAAGARIRDALEKARQSFIDFMAGLNGLKVPVETPMVNLGRTIKVAFEWIVANKDTILNALAGILAAILAYKAVSGVIGIIQGFRAALMGLASVAAFSEALSAGVPVLGAIGAAISASILPVLAIVAAIALLVGAFVLAYQRIEPFRKAVDNFVATMATLASGVISDAVALFQNVLLPIFEHVASTVQQNLMPAFNAFADFMATTVLPNVQKLAVTFTAIVMPALFGVVGVVARVLGKIIEFISFVSGKVIPVVLQLAGPVIGILVDNLRAIWSAGAAVIGFLVEFVNTIMDVIDGNMSLSDALSKIWSGLQTMILAVVNSIGGFLWKLGSTFVQWIIDAASKLPGLLATFGQTLLGWLATAVGWIGQKMGEWAVAFLSWAGTAIAQLPGKLARLAGFIIGWLIGFAASLPSRVNQISVAFMSWVFTVVSQIGSKIGEISLSVFSWIATTAQQLPGKIAGWVTGFLSWAATAIEELPGKLVTLAATLWGWVSQTASEAPSQAESIGSNIVSGLWNGISNMTQWILGQLQSFGQGVIDGLKAALGIHSPSTLTAEMGDNLMRGLAVGIARSAGVTAQAVTRSATALAPVLKWVGSVIGTAMAAGIATSRARAVREAQLALADAQAALADAKQRVKDAKTTADKARAQRDVVRAQWAVDDARSAARNAGSDFDKQFLAKIASAAQARLDAMKQHAKEVLDFAKNISDQMKQFGQITTLNMPDGAAPTLNDLLGNMKGRLDAISKFGSLLGTLQKMGLNKDVLQQIIAAGPVQGSAIAQAIVDAGKQGVSQVNSAQSALSAASMDIGAIGANAQYGAGAYGRAQAVNNTKITVANGAVQVNFGRGVSASDQRDIKKTIDDAIRKALADAAREANR